MDKIIEVNHLTKRFGDIVAVDDISFWVNAGSLFAFLGPNGAGKSTTINCMTTLLAADAGAIEINSHKDPKDIRKDIGVVFQENVLDNELTVKENLVVRGTLATNNRREAIRRYQEIEVFLSLQDIANRRFQTLSGGQKRRVEIARALFSNPKILMLDEPTTGLDPETRQTVWKLVNTLRKQEGLTIFLTTHYMEEAAEADHVVIIDRGKIVASGTPATLKDTYSSDRLKIVPHDVNLLHALLRTMKRPFEVIADMTIVTVEESGEAIDIINAARANIKTFELIKGTMDDVFIEVIGGNHNG
ncbi:MAG: ATP-binding cassette domain-containing protein [Acholeplasmataceae bacterium]|nr:ATP-binding cassette domain-containing protein [Acholeplasmataceae bacterium]